MSLTFICDGNSKGSIVHVIEIAQSRDYGPVPCDLEIAHWCCTILRLRKPSVQSRDWHIIRDSENAQHNLEIAQIPRLRGTYISHCTI